MDDPETVNCTRVPGVPPLTVAVSVTGWPAVAGFGAASTVVVVLAGLVTDGLTVTFTIPVLGLVVVVPG